MHLHTLDQPTPALRSLQEAKMLIPLQWRLRRRRLPRYRPKSFRHFLKTGCACCHQLAAPLMLDYESDVKPIHVAFAEQCMEDLERHFSLAFQQVEQDLEREPKLHLIIKYLLSNSTSNPFQLGTPDQPHQQ